MTVEPDTVFDTDPENAVDDSAAVDAYAAAVTAAVIGLGVTPLERGTT